jgi:hypothetical protein
MTFRNEGEREFWREVYVKAIGVAVPGIPEYLADRAVELLRSREEAPGVG